MMRINNTTKYFGVSVVFLLMCLGAAYLLLEYMNGKGQRLEEVIEVVGTNQAYETQHASMSKLLEDTRTDRAKVSSYVLGEERTINFINDSETLARDMGLVFSTDSLNVAVHPNPYIEQLEMNLSAVGDRATVEEFLHILETLPYLSHITSLTLSREGVSQGSSWRARIELFVGLHKEQEADAEFRNEINHE